MNEEDPKQPLSDSGPPTPQAPEPPPASGGAAEGGEGRAPAVEAKDSPVLGFPTSDGVKEGEKSAVDDAGIGTDSRVEDRISGGDGEEWGVEAEKRLATEGDSTVHVAEGEDFGGEGRDEDFGVEDVEMVDDVQLGFTDLGAGGEVRETELPRVEGEEVRGVSGEEAGISSLPCNDGENSKEVEERSVKEEEMVVEEAKSLDESMEIDGGSVPVDEIKTVGGDVSTQVNDLDVKMEEKAVEVLQQPDVREEVEVKAKGDAELVREMDDSKPMVSPVAPPTSVNGDKEMIEVPTPVSAGDGNTVGVDSDAAAEQKDLSVYSGAFAFDGITVGADLVAAAEQKDLSVYSGASAGDGNNVGADSVEVAEEKDVLIHNGASAGDGNIMGDVSVAVTEDKDVPVNGGASATDGNPVVADSVAVVEEKGDRVDDGASAGDANTAGVDSVAAPEEKDLSVYSEASAGDGNTVGDDSVAVAEENDLSVSGEASTKGGGRKKRGRAPTVTSRSQKPPSTKKTEEDVCFICFDGGNLVVCDRRGCPKVYHPSCVNRDEAFFRARGRWNCGWHICSICEKAAQYMCYTCTYSLCKGCSKESAFVCVRGNKGLCETCRGTVMLIETSDQVKFDDKNSWEYLFKDYWLDLKEKQSITLDELTKARKPLKRSSVPNEESSDERFEANEGAGSSSDNSSGQRRGRTTRSNTKKKVKKRHKVNAKEDNSAKIGNSVGSSISGDNPWASNELLEFISHMRGGDVSVLSQFDVQALLLEYIKQNNLRDPRRKSHIICDSRLERLFGKKRVGHFEMLKLLELHFLIKEPSQSAIDEDIGAADYPDGGQAEVESCDVGTRVSEKKRKTRKKEERGVKSNFGDYAAVDVHNIGLIYLRRNLMEDLIDDVENFNQKVIGSFVRIRISGAGQKQDMYRIVQVVGVTKAAEKYKTGKRTTDIALEILNLNKMEVIPIDSISNQDFTEEECKRLRQSIKCGLMRPMTVGDLEEKAMALQAARVNDWLESEKLRLGHLRDRASEKGRRKELRECVEKLQLLSTPEERSRRLNEIPEIHADPNMDPSYESAEEKETDDKRKDKYNRLRDLGIARKGRELISPRSAASHDSWTSGRNAASTTPEPIRNAARDPYGYDDTRAHEPIETPTSLARAASSGQTARNSVAVPGQSTETGMSPVSSINESEKMWHYQDPSGKMQGPFSMVQLRKWNSTGYFPRDLRVWRTSERQEDSILLTDAFIGRFQKELPVFEYQDNTTSQLLKPIVDTREMTRDGGWRGNTVPVKPVQSDGTFPGAGQAHNNPISAAPLAGKSHQPPSLGPARVVSGGNPVGHHGSTWNSSRPAALHTSSVGRYSDLLTPTPGLTGASGHSNITRWDATSIQGVNAFQSPTIEPSRAAGWVERGAVQGSVQDPQNIPSAGEKKNNVDMYQNPVCPSPTPKSEQSIFISNVNQNDRNRGSDAAPVNASEWSMPSPTPSVNPSGSGMGPETVSVPVPTFGESVNKSTADQTVGSVAAGAIQANTNVGWGSAVQSSTNINWGLQQGPANVGWLDPTQGNVNMNMGWGSAGQVNPAASAVWRPPVQANTTMNAGWTAMQGNPNQNVGWSLTPLNANVAANWVPAAQGYSNQNPGWVAMNQETTSTNGVWVAPIQGNANNQIAGWRAPAQGNPNPTPAYGSGNGNINPGFSAPSGNNSNSWGPQRENKDRHSSHVEGGYQGNNTGPGSGRHRMPPGSGGSSGPSQGDQSGVCRFHESGHCKKGSSCNYLHT